jgi:AraC family transcriptional regulator
VNETTAKAYAQCFNRVLDYIDANLDAALSVEQLSRIANFSKYHFLRQFSQYAGMSLFSYIRLMRFKQASYRLAINAQERIIDIALDTGFENPESFSRAFKNTFGQTPTQFRQHPEWKPWSEKYQLPRRERSGNMEVNIVDFSETPVALLEHRGAPALLNESVMKFIAWRKESGLSPVKSSKTFGIAYDDPAQTEPEAFRFDICGSISDGIPENPQGVKNSIIPGGRCAVLRHLGSHDRIDEGAYYLYREWLPESGEELRDFPLFFHYLNLIPETAEADLVTDIYLPLK